MNVNWESACFKVNSLVMRMRRKKEKSLEEVTLDLLHLV